MQEKCYIQMFLLLACIGGMLVWSSFLSFLINVIYFPITEFIILFIETSNWDVRAGWKPRLLHEYSVKEKKDCCLY